MMVNLQEIYRYLGIMGNRPDDATKKLVGECLEELERAAKPRSFSRSFPMSVLPDGSLDFTCFSVKSEDLKKNLKGCEEVILFAATLGAGVDLLLCRYTRLEVSRAVVLQAAAAAMIEAYCDEKNQELRIEAKKRGLFLRPRFSPGYGDFSVSCQRELCRALSAEKTVGIMLTESFMMNPSKSVTAVIGAGREELSCAKSGCEACRKQDCLYRRNEIQ